MTKTKKNPLKEQREWNELLHAKKKYILRKQEEEDADRRLRDAFAEDFPNTWGYRENDPPE